MPHQKEGALRANKILNIYGGVLIADEVGLGKTYIGGALVREMAVRGSKSLIIVPNAVLRIWENYVKEKKLTNHVIVTTYGNVLKHQKGDMEEAYSSPYGFGLILIDEAHNLRNNDTIRYKDIRNKIIKENNTAKIVLMTATPVNNKTEDLRWILILKQ